jgi:integrase
VFCAPARRSRSAKARPLLGAASGFAGLAAAVAPTRASRARSRAGFERRLAAPVVRGLPPAADELQFIDRSRILEAQKRVADSLDDEPLICGVDVAGGGTAWNVMAFRRGGDARSIPRIRIPGEHTRDRGVRVGKLAEILRDTRHDLRRTCARLCHLACGELEQIQFLLGHASVQTTERYLGCKQKFHHAVNDNLGLEDS